MSSSSANRRELDAAVPDNINTELAAWKQLIFHSDMSPPQENTQNNDPSRSRIPPVYFQAPHTVPPPLPPETYTYLIQALLSLQGSAYPPTFPYPTPPSTAPPLLTSPAAGPPLFYPANPPIPLPSHTVPQGTSSSRLTPSPAASPTTASTAYDLDGTEDATSTAEDKRRRNTAASARFRIKKKLKTLNLERTVTDLTGRTDELEREANDLRRENAWLKEIVLLKGRTLAAPNAGSQAPAPVNQHDGSEEEARTHTGSEIESTVKHDGKGKSKESRGN